MEITLISVSELQSIMRECITTCLKESGANTSNPTMEITLKPTDDRLLTQSEVAKMLRCSKPTLIRMVKEGVIKSHRLGNNVRYKYSDVQAALQERNFVKK